MGCPPEENRVQGGIVQFPLVIHVEGPVERVCKEVAGNQEICSLEHDTVLDTPVPEVHSLHTQGGSLGATLLGIQTARQGKKEWSDSEMPLDLEDGFGHCGTNSLRRKAHLSLRRAVEVHPLEKIVPRCLGDLKVMGNLGKAAAAPGDRACGGPPMADQRCPAALMVLAAKAVSMAGQIVMVLLLVLRPGLLGSWSSWVDA